MPTRNRPDFVARAFSFLEAQGFRGHLHLVDASDGDKFVTPIKRPFEVTHHRPRRPGDAWREIADALADVPSRYIQLHHDDDFYFLDEIDAAIEALEQNPSAATAQGRSIFVEHKADGSISLAGHDRFAYLAETAPERVAQCFDRFGHLAFAVTRRTNFVAVLNQVHPVLEQGWFDQYAISLLLAARGPALVADRLFGVRELHAAQHHRQFVDAKAYKHWPLIVASPDFSATFAAFKGCLLAGVPGLTPLSIDTGLVSLIGRAAGQMPEREDGDVQLFERANVPRTQEHTRVTRVVAALRAAKPSI